MARKLKVYRTPIGFHDAYVAAPSMKAALAAWGSDADLFTRGIAEEVTDPALMAAPLAAPGEIVRVARGSADDHVSALPKDKPGKTSAKRDAAPRPRAPRPSRDALDAADQAVADADAGFAAREDAIREKEAAVAAERTALTRERSAAMRKLKAARDDAKDRYEHALSNWNP